jgi:hypothetical protein
MTLVTICSASVVDSPRWLAIRSASRVFSCASRSCMYSDFHSLHSSCVRSSSRDDTIQPLSHTMIQSPATPPFVSSGTYCARSDHWIPEVLIDYSQSHTTPKLLW